MNRVFPFLPWGAIRNYDFSPFTPEQSFYFKFESSLNHNFYMEENTAQNSFTSTANIL